MKKTYEKPVLTTERFDAEDVIATSGLATGTGTWETDQVSSETLAGMGILIH
ncbi:MAG: hypothetical protein IJT44_02750 [Clostridia bacterium]|nr:hypothetical protein [Clostridia bacterium]